MSKTITPQIGISVLYTRLEAERLGVPLYFKNGDPSTLGKFILDTCERPEVQEAFAATPPLVPEKPSDLVREVYDSFAEGKDVRSIGKDLGEASRTTFNRRLANEYREMPGRLGRPSVMRRIAEYDISQQGPDYVTLPKLALTPVEHLTAMLLSRGLSASRLRSLGVRAGRSVLSKLYGKCEYPTASGTVRQLFRSGQLVPDAALHTQWLDQHKT